MVSQCGQLWGVRHVNAAGRGDVAETPGGCVSGRVGRLVDDLCAVVRLGFGILPKHQFVALNRSSHSKSGTSSSSGRGGGGRPR